ncbi:DUF2304 domain-containing protein [Cryobacterium algoricola]|uniref:DUF2304 domain-containing protein n=1 Tax=Cryobacterium algoricola TaxID=1259183 RepID=A0ABY2IK92_9MICO|nr:DUF2304 domain-containing protein [Cryobacterium algoricola]TFB91265.1 DUF2304 domain-containing protein [Cryobacterium algoricola]
MNTTSYVLGVAAAILILVVVIELLRKRRLRERHAVWWLAAGLLALLVSIFPVSLEWAAGVVGIQVPTNLVFFVGIAILVLVCLQHSAELTRAEEKVRSLAESLALVELRLRQVETQLSRETTPPDPDADA